MAKKKRYTQPFKSLSYIRTIAEDHLIYGYFPLEPEKRDEVNQMIMRFVEDGTTDQSKEPRVNKCFEEIMGGLVDRLSNYAEQKNGNKLGGIMRSLQEGKMLSDDSIRYLLENNYLTDEWLKSEKAKKDSRLTDERIQRIKARARVLQEIDTLAYSMINQTITDDEVQKIFENGYYDRLVKDERIAKNTDAILDLKKRFERLHFSKR